MKVFALISRFFSIFMGAGVMTLVRSNVLMALVTLLMAHSGTWKYFASSLAAHDVKQVAAWAVPRPPTITPVMVAVDDEGYQAYFQGRSPVSRERMLAMLQVLQAHTPVDVPVVIDIDLSPGPEDKRAQQRLDQFLLQHPRKWVLPALKSTGSMYDESIRQWRKGLCAAGVSFGLPYVPTEFGYPKLTQQYVHSLADAVLAPGLDCVDPDAAWSTKTMPLQASYLHTGTVIPFSGDLTALGEMLELVKPDVIFLGGMWGTTDIVGTPFGDRYGVHVHAAALAGAYSSERLAPRWVDLLASWLFLSLMSVWLNVQSRGLTRWSGLPAPSMYGHLFFVTRGKPLLFVLTVLAGLYAWVDLLSLWHAHTGMWINTAQVAATVVAYTMVVWNFGRVEPDLFGGMRATCEKVLILPIGNDLLSMRQSWAILAGRQQDWLEPGRQVKVTRCQALFEWLCASFSLLMQTGVPLVSSAYLLYSLM